VLRRPFVVRNLRRYPLTLARLSLKGSPVAESRRTVSVLPPTHSPRVASAPGHSNQERVNAYSQVFPSAVTSPLLHRGSALFPSLLPSSLPNSPAATSRSLILLGGGEIQRSPSPPLRRRRAQSLTGISYLPPALKRNMSLPGGGSTPRVLNDFDRARARDAQRLNDAMVYLDGAQIYSCAQCRTHLTSHDDIISKSFHGRHGRAYLFDQCVNVDLGPAEDRLLITGMHSVSDLFCKRCKSLVGWTYNKAYENSQKYKEGKFIIEKINLHLEESDYYQAAPPAGEKTDRWRKRSMSWGSESSPSNTQSMVYEYRPCVG
jgi:Yippee zinc-binding/DNA-binding /Mis18, centromere assembly